MSGKFFKDECVAEFLQGKGAELTAETVEELIDILQQLPPKFKIHQGFSKSVSVCIYNLRHENRHIQFDDGE
jgi:hypothetical protein